MIRTKPDKITSLRLKGKVLKDAIEFMSKNRDLIDAEDWKEFDKKVRNNFIGIWASYGIIWTSIYNICPDVFEELGYIPDGAFAYTDIDSIDISNSNLQSIGVNAFYQSSLKRIDLNKDIQLLNVRSLQIPGGSHMDIYYPGAYKEWRHIRKENEYLSSQYNKTSADIHCSDTTVKYHG